MVTKTLLIMTMAMGFLQGTVPPAFSAPRPDLWSRWEKNNPQSAAEVDHGLWGEFLARVLITDHPSGINRVRYSAVEPADRQKLADYVKRLQTVEVDSLSRAEQKAYWINFYNALTVKVILDHYPVKSIRDIDISPGLFSNGPWDAKLVRVQGEDVSLNDMEHRIMRPIWKDNRIHYAVNCASLGCPNLQLEPFTARNVESLLEKAAGEYINHPRGARFDGDRLVVSSIYSWFRIDFGTSDEDLVRHLLRYARGALGDKLRNFRGAVDHAYDWALNE
jgi:hypothetical protein